MPRPSVVEFRRTVLTLVAAMVSGALAGAIAGWTVAPYVNVPEFPTPAPTEGTGNVTSTPSEPDVTVIPIDRTPQVSLIPSPFLERRLSPVAGVYRREKGNDQVLLTDERLVSQAVSVTSDGWFVMPAILPEGLRLSDLLVWHEGVSATPTRAVLDKLSGVIFLKTSLTNLNAPAFARPTDVTPGLAAWLERRAERFESLGVIAAREPLQTLDGVSSEVVARQGLTNGIAATGDRGAPLWSGNGALIGLVISPPGEAMRYIPASAWTASLSSLLSTGNIHHALLGVHATDLAWVHLQERSALPERGALLREDKKGRKPAVTPTAPAFVAGLKAGDVIQRVDRDILDGSADLGELLAEYRPGSRVTLTVLRGTESLEIPVEMGTVVTSQELK